jgi:hypothetical protein
MIISMPVRQNLCRFSDSREVGDNQAVIYPIQGVDPTSGLFCQVAYWVVVVNGEG